MAPLAETAALERIDSPAQINAFKTLMGNLHAIRTTCEAVIALLQTNRLDPGWEFEVYTRRNFDDPMATGVSLFLYRLEPNVITPAPAGRRFENGQQRVQLPLDLYFILTAWSSVASTQNLLAAWMMRTLADTPLIPHSLLEATGPGVFAQDERIEVKPADFPTEDLFHLWEAVSPNNYHLSVPYVARNVRIESTELLPPGRRIQTRVADFQTDEVPPT